jgi:hypothetical protein
MSEARKLSPRKEMEQAYRVHRLASMKLGQIPLTAEQFADWWKLQEQDDFWPGGEHGGVSD